MSHDEGLSPEALPLFDDIMTTLAQEMEADLLASLSVKIATHKPQVERFSRHLAFHEDVAVAAPVLQHMNILSDHDLVNLVENRSQGHIQAISRRAQVSTQVSDAIIEKGSDETLNILVRNRGAQFSRQGAETLTDKAQANPDLLEGLVHNRRIPVDLVNELYFVAEARVRNLILERNAGLDPHVLDEALKQSRDRVALRHGALPADFEKAMAKAEALKNRGGLGPADLAAMVREPSKTQFVAALAVLAEVDYITAQKVIDRREFDALAILCKASDLPRSLFLTFAVVLLNDDANAMAKAQSYGRLYQDLPVETAMRTIRFWRMRRGEGPGLAHAPAA